MQMRHKVHKKIKNKKIKKKERKGKKKKTRSTEKKKEEEKVGAKSTVKAPNNSRF